MDIVPSECRRFPLKLPQLLDLGKMIDISYHPPFNNEDQPWVYLTEGLSQTNLYRADKDVILHSWNKPLKPRVGSEKVLRQVNEGTQIPMRIHYLLKPCLERHAFVISNLLHHSRREEDEGATVRDYLKRALGLRHVNNIP
jgi:hypothetical protein